MDRPCTLPVVHSLGRWILVEYYTVIAAGSILHSLIATGSEGRFSLDPDTGDLKTLQRLPFGSSAKYSLAVSAQIVGMVSSKTTLTQVVTVKGGNVNPQFSKTKYIIDMDEFDANNKPTKENP